MRRIAAKWMMVLAISGVGLWASEEEVRACQTCTESNQACNQYAADWCSWWMGRSVWWTNNECYYDESGCVINSSCTFQCTPEW
jgi:hypothetical protein